MSVLALVLLVMAGAFHSAVAQKCSEYGPTVTLTGKLSSKVMPGPPNYTSIRQGDQKETVLLLTLAKAVCTTGNDPNGIDVPEAGIRALNWQLPKTGTGPLFVVYLGKGQQ